MLISRLVTTAAMACLAILVAGCTPSSAQQPRMPAPDEVVAVVGSTTFTLAQVDAKALQQPTGNFGGMKLSQALYEARRMAIDELIDEALIAEDGKTRKLERAQIDQEIASKVIMPTDGEVEAFYKENQARLQGATLDQTRVAIRGFLTEQRTLSARDAYVNALRAKAAVRVTLEPPRQAIAKVDRPAKGPADAPIEIIEFSDFECPFCLSALPTVARVLTTYGDRIRFVYRHYPLPNHPRARPAAEASQCAAEQGQFWPYHDRLFADQSRLTDTDLKRHAAELGLDAAQFNACFDSQKYKTDVEVDMQAGTEAGVSGTPAFYINGRMLSGAQPFEVFQQIIDDELQRLR